MGTADLNLVVGIWDTTRWQWDARTGEEVHRLIGDTTTLNEAVYSPDSRYVLTIDDDGARLWDAKTGESIGRFGDIIGVNRATFSPDGKYVLTSAELGTPLFL
jgi:WD40 repeat protein